ncbi:9095_t:CDS:2 [Entrophospora sp. SA101]|nr:9095_t:CDS:2 [Entrophospora sp. SA101]
MAKGLLEEYGKWNSIEQSIAAFLMEYTYHQMLGTYFQREIFTNINKILDFRETTKIQKTYPNTWHILPTSNFEIPVHKIYPSLLATKNSSKIIKQECQALKYEKYLRDIDSNNEADNIQKQRKRAANDLLCILYEKLHRDLKSVVICPQKIIIIVSLINVENPFFIEFVNQLKPAYKLPSRFKLSKDFINEEVANVNVKVELELKRQNNITLGKGNH